MRLFGLIGFPLVHSFSKNYFNSKFEKEGLQDCRYENFPLPSINDFPAILENNPGLEGLNVTIPHKESVLHFLHEKNDIVKQVRACNCIRIQKGKLTGYNTDVIAFEKILLEKIKLSSQNALILGTGGSSKAVKFVLKKHGIPYQSVSRKQSVNQLSYDQLTPAIIQKAGLIINTTPLGMFPKITQAPPIPYEALGPKHFLFDLIYNPEKTLFLQKGEQQGTSIQNGYDMLVYQAEENWKIWNG